MSNDEAERLDAVAADSWYLRPTNKATIEYSARIFSRFIRGGSVLEMGPAEGVMTAHLKKLAGKLTVVEGTEKFCSIIRERYPDIDVHHSLFEEYAPTERFDSIVLGHVLEHVTDPTDILRIARKWLAPGGRILAAVPNARSLHRQAAVVMGMLESEEGMTEQDVHHGHRRVFNPESYRQVFYAAGLKIECFGGYWLKPISAGQVEASWSEDMIEAFMQLGERYPDIAGEIYVIATNEASAS